MVPGRVSVVIPSRHERFLPETVRDVLSKAQGDLEVLVILDGYWAHDLPDDPRLVQIHRGAAQGMRPAINSACAVATGEYLCKLDAHCAVAAGFDVVLKADCDRDWVVVPRRYRLDPIAWAWQDVGKPPIDSHYLSYPYERQGDASCGLHGTVWEARAKARADLLIDDEMSSQGSCWCMHRDQWARVGPLDVAHYGNFIQEFQEIGLKTWLGGGAVKVNKQTWYAHLHKGTTYGRGYSMAGFHHERGRAFCTDYWMHDRWPQRVRDLRWLVEKFAPVPSWPADLDQAFARRAA